MDAHAGRQTFINTPVYWCVQACARLRWSVPTRVRAPPDTCVTRVTPKCLRSFAPQVGLASGSCGAQQFGAHGSATVLGSSPNVGERRVLSGGGRQGGSCSGSPPAGGIRCYLSHCKHDHPSPPSRSLCPPQGCR